MSTRYNARRLCLAYQGHLRVATDVVEGPSCRVVRQDVAPLIYDVNHLQVDDDVDPEEALAFLEAVMGDRDYRKVLLTPFAPPGFEARLAHEGFEAMASWQGLLTGPLRGPAPVDCIIRAVESEEDWAHLDRLVRLDHEETDAKLDRSIYTLEVTRQIQAVRRLAQSQIRFFLAWDRDEPVAFFSAWPGLGGSGSVGMVEDLYTLPSHRGRGFARALIHHCVSDARARGADAVLIGAYPDDTPKQAYAAMGFEPTCLTWEWLKTSKDV